MGIHLADQTLTFLHAILLGAVLGALYDVFRILRIALPHGKGAVFAEDLLFWIFCAVASFLFLLTSSDGVVRVFLLVGEIIGAVLYHFTLGALVMKVAQAIIDAVRAVLRFLWRFLLRPIWRLLYAIISLLLRPVRFLSETMKNSLRKMKFRLKVRRVVLYNHFIGRLQRMAANGKIPADSPGENIAYGGKDEGEKNADA